MTSFARVPHKTSTYGRSRIKVPADRPGRLRASTLVNAGRASMKTEELDGNDCAVGTTSGEEKSRAFREKPLG